jgi:hypothetical protein
MKPKKPTRRDAEGFDDAPLVDAIIRKAIEDYLEQHPVGDE